MHQEPESNLTSCEGAVLLPEIPGAPFLPQLILMGQVFGAFISLPQSVSKRQTQE